LSGSWRRPAIPIEVAQLGNVYLAEAFLDDEAALEGETPG
jgi:hypothetical protein